MKNILSTCMATLVLLLTGTSVTAQTKHQNPEGVTVSVTQAFKLGTTPPLRDLVPVPGITQEKKQLSKKQKQIIPNFAGRQEYHPANKNAYPHGEDPVLQKGYDKNLEPLEPKVLIEGMDNSISFAVPPDPHGDIGSDYLVQMVNSTFLQVFDKEGNELSSPISTNTIWSAIGISAFSDPIIMYDQEFERWVLTEIGSDISLAVAVSDTDDPLGTWTAYSFATPDLPDYPKYGVWPNAYVVTTNEEGPGVQHTYLINRSELMNGEPTVTVQRITLPGISGGPGFQVSTPIDWSGTIAPPVDALPMIIRPNDDAWGEVAQDRVEIWEFDVDWTNADNTVVTQTNINTAAYDIFPCAVSGPGFSCIPQPNGTGIDGLPDVIMSQSHYRNFGAYESVVYNMITDATGDNLSGIRWAELRRTSGENWSVYQEGTFAPDDGQHRFMGAIAIDALGNIGLGYCVSGPDRFPSLAITGRRASDPLGEMTFDELLIAEGTTNSPDIRYGDYFAMSVDPTDDRTFFFTGEYISNGWRTSIVTFELPRDTNDIGPIALVEPVTSPDLTDMEQVTIEVKNFGLEDQTAFNVGYILDGGVPVIEPFNGTVLASDDTYTHTFIVPADCNTVGEYTFDIFTDLDGDESVLNDTLRVVISKLPRFDAGISDIQVDNVVCGTETEVTLVLTNFGTEVLTSAVIELQLNSVTNQTTNWTGSLNPGDSEEIVLTVSGLVDGSNEVTGTTFLPNGEMDEIPVNDSFSRTFNVVTNGDDYTLLLQTDFFPNETTWELRDENGVLLFSGGPYGEENTLYEEVWCLGSDQCYEFTIFDSYGDGLGFFSGFYQIEDADGELLASIINVNFGFQETNEFCPGVDCMLGADVVVNPVSESGATDGAIMINPVNGAGPFQYSIDNGDTFQTGNLFTDLGEGEYFILIIDDLNCTYLETVEIGVCAVDGMANIINETAPGASDGVIGAFGSNGTPPYEYSIDNGTTFNMDGEFTGLPAGDYQVLIVDAVGCSTTIDVTIDQETSVSEAQFGYSVVVFPNPTEGLFRVKVEGLPNASPQLSFELFDAQGKLIQTRGLSRYSGVFEGTISLVAYPDGVYFLRFKDENIHRMIRIVKQ